MSEIAPQSCKLQWSLRSAKLVVEQQGPIQENTPVRPGRARRHDLSLGRHLRIGSKRLAGGIGGEKFLRGDLIRQASQLLGRDWP